MNATQLFFAPGTTDQMKKLAQNIPAYDLLKAYREARATFNTNDIVLIIADSDPEGFIAKPRSVYVNEAFRKWTQHQRAAHPLAKESAHSKVKLPSDMPAFWLVMEFHEKDAVACCAIGAVLQNQLVS